MKKSPSTPQSSSHQQPLPENPHLKRHSSHRWSRKLESFSYDVSRWAGSSWAFFIACSTIVVWVLTGPLFGFSDTWQLVINTSTTIVTFLMVFLIQRAQNKDALAIQLKLNELVAAMPGASNRLIDIEDLTEEELAILHQHFRILTAIASREKDLLLSHSVEEAKRRHHRKKAGEV